MAAEESLSILPQNKCIIVVLCESCSGPKTY